MHKGGVGRASRRGGGRKCRCTTVPHILNKRPHNSGGTLPSASPLMPHTATAPQLPTNPTPPSPNPGLHAHTLGPPILPCCCTARQHQHLRRASPHRRSTWHPHTPHQHTLWGRSFVGALVTLIILHITPSSHLSHHHHTYHHTSATGLWLGTPSHVCRGWALAGCGPAIHHS